MPTRKRAPTTPELKKALIRAVNAHGHYFHCSAARGVDSDCSCGWVEIQKLVARITPVKKKQ